ncbi:MAG: hypothetical protein J6U75_01035, partial [Clostridia bacterium]|nr:hypothetical protein [Clostridia bacterium]
YEVHRDGCFFLAAEEGFALACGPLLAVPEKSRAASPLCFFDRCGCAFSLHPPPAALKRSAVRVRSDRRGPRKFAEFSG